MFAYFDGLLIFLVMLVLLVFLQRFLHQEMQAVFLILFRRPDFAIGLFSFIFFPGVVLHEFSHFLMAKILRVRTGKFSLMPQMLSDGRLRMGYVETGRTDPLRDSLIGLAPLLAGGVFVSLVAAYPMELETVWEFLKGGNITLFLMALQVLPTLPDFWLWFYLAFVVSSTMMPSASDRHAWRYIGIFAAIMLVLALLAGVGPWMLENLAKPLNSMFKSVSLIFALSAMFHAFLILPVLFLHRLMTRITGLDVK